MRTGYKGGRPPKFTLPQRREIKKIAKAKPAEYDLPFSAWSLSKLADVAQDAGDPEIVFCVDEFGPLNLQPRPGRHWAAISGKNKEPGRAPRPRLRATYTRTAGVRHLFAAYELGEDKLYGHIKPRKTGPGSWSSAGTCARCTRPPPGSRSSAITSART